MGRSPILFALAVLPQQASSLPPSVLLMVFEVQLLPIVYAQSRSSLAGARVLGSRGQIEQEPPDEEFIVRGHDLDLGPSVLRGTFLVPHAEDH